MPDNPKKLSTIRFELNALVLACVLPVWLLAAVLVLHVYGSKLDEVNRDMQSTARAMTMVVDRELASVQGALLALATSPSFPNRDFADVHRQALELLKSYPGADIIVADITGQQLVNSFRPYGTALPKRNNLHLVRTIFDSGKPHISNLFFGAVTKRPLIAIDVPVLIDGKVAYDLSMTFSSDRMASILQRQDLPTGWYCSVLDRGAVIVARTSEPLRFVGKQENPAFRRAMALANEGAVDITSDAGVPMLAAFSKSAISGWSVTFGEPRDTVMAEIYHWMSWAIGGAAAISLIGIMLAMGIARRIAGDIQTLVNPALAIGRGDLVTAIGIDAIKETAEVAEALIQASELLHQREKERDKAELQLSKTIEDLRVETAERLKAMEELRQNEQLLIHQSRQAALGEMIGNIAHQWRQPLNSLGLLVQEVPLTCEYGEVDREFLEDNAKRSMDIIMHMSETIDDFRNFFKPLKEKVVFNVREEVAKTFSLIEASFQAHHISLEIESQADPVTEGYPNEFCQVLLNILGNAKDVISERQIADPRVVITITTEGTSSVVTVADNAGGVPEEIIDRIFDPYFTTKSPQLGTGVGLFMSKTIIEKNMGGELTVRNVDGGAQFTIKL